ncbi:MAG: hypothetical protein HY873_11240 [Chloroflexi bacterium]|nr:hypothetical protein [Chloroflexota bacterium]
MRRTDRERRRLAMAHALRNAQRLLNLSDNPLVDEPAVRRLAAERYGDAVMKEELALSDVVLACANTVLQRVGDDRRLEREAALLRTVIAGGSVCSAAKALGLSREHLSNTAWRTVSGWVLDEFEASKGGSVSPRTSA